jgi:hypothetical protein
MAMIQTQTKRPEWDVADDEVVHVLCDCQFDGYGRPLVPVTAMCGNLDDDPEVVVGEVGTQCPLCWAVQSCPACGG